MSYAYLVVMLFSTGAVAGESMWNLPCPDWACVENAIEHAPESSALVRLRVYEGQVAVSHVSKVPVGSPKLDLWFQ